MISLKKINAAEHLGLARKICRSYVPSGPVEDTPEYSDAVDGLLDAAKSFDETKTPFFSKFAFRCMRNRIISGRKSRRLRRTESLDFEPTWSETGLDFLDLSYFLTESPDDTDADILNRKILTQHYLNGLSWQEIGDGLGISRVAAMQRGQRAIHSIRKRFNIDVE